MHLKQLVNPVFEALSSIHETQRMVGTTDLFDRMDNREKLMQIPLFPILYFFDPPPSQTKISIQWKHLLKITDFPRYTLCMAIEMILLL